MTPFTAAISSARTSCVLHRGPLFAPVLSLARGASGAGGGSTHVQFGRAREGRSWQAQAQTRELATVARCGQGMDTGGVMGSNMVSRWQQQHLATSPQKSQSRGVAIFGKKYKLKTHSGAKKRFKPIANGQFKRWPSGGHHNKRKLRIKARRLKRKATLVSHAWQKKMLRRLMPYA
ncbi:hypothetical protein M427DRAFT_133052 [Gonapodya prolifera JEL478]|uniref:50S ribosomal protein L35 n=1 Tax=Gonapodya prolifera (strain JEL478) TaxID=1344416 RepID=A0A139AM81_GONPJ|nr:hypothetical protein M427DRAFT_133052 [Gonapodya prolifera JEL478]|eukprot:KXS17877.1 hypothetical protein M427DRAFT_133052 [Gonapodya prolifera JEL478]